MHRVLAVHCSSAYQTMINEHLSSPQTSAIETLYAIDGLNSNTIFSGNLDKANLTTVWSSQKVVGWLVLPGSVVAHMHNNINPDPRKHNEHK